MRIRIQNTKKERKRERKEADVPSCSVSVVGEKVGERAVAGLVTSPGGEGLVTHATEVKQLITREGRENYVKELAETKFSRNSEEKFLKMVLRNRNFCALLKKPKTKILLV